MRPSRADLAARVAACVLAALALVRPQPARAEEHPPVRASAKAHLDSGLRLYDAHQFAAAAAEFEATYALDPQRDVLYVWAQALRLGGQCARAVALYQQFLDAAPPAAEAKRARANQARCRAEIAAASPAPSAVPPVDHSTDGGNPPPPRAPTPVALTPLPAPEASLAQAPSPVVRHRLDRLDQVLLGGGGLALAVGGGFYLSARSERDQAQSAATYGQVQQHADAARTRDRLAWGALSVGVGLLGAALLRLAWQ